MTRLQVTGLQVIGLHVMEQQVHRLQMTRLAGSDGVASVASDRAGFSYERVQIAAHGSCTVIGPLIIAAHGSCITVHI